MLRLTLFLFAIADLNDRKGIQSCNHKRASSCLHLSPKNACICTAKKYYSFAKSIYELSSSGASSPIELGEVQQKVDGEGASAA